MEFYHLNMQLCVHTWGAFILAAMRLGLRLVNYPQEDTAVGQMDAEAAAALEVLEVRLYPDK